MATNKKNTYVIGSNNDLTNGLANIDYNRVNTDLTVVEWSGSDFIVKEGSTLEVNGNLYTVESADETISAASGAVVYNESTGWAISSDTPVLRPDKGGYYLSDGVTRVTRWDVLSSGSVYINANRQLFGEGNVDIEAHNIIASGDVIVSGDGTFNNIILSGALSNEAVESQGFSGDISYIKYDSGVAICWGLSNEGVVNFDTAYGALYYAINASALTTTLPITFLSNPTPRAGGTINITGIGGLRGLGVSGNILFASVWSAVFGEATTSVEFVVVGKWK
jgi:hypothetical protein